MSATAIPNGGPRRGLPTPTAGASGTHSAFSPSEDRVLTTPAGSAAVVKTSTYKGDQPTSNSAHRAVQFQPISEALSLLPDPHLLDPPGSTSLSSVFTLCNSAVGAGVLALPFAFSKAGLLGGLFLCIVIGSLEGCTLYVLSKFAERYEAHTYTMLIRSALGKKLGIVLAVVQSTYLFGSCSAYLIIMGDTFSSIAGQALGNDHLLAQRDTCIIGLTLLVALPLCFFRKMGALAHCSAVAVAGFAYTALAVVLRGTQAALERCSDPSTSSDPSATGSLLSALAPGQLLSSINCLWGGADLLRLDFGTLYAIPLVVFGFNCHANVVTIFSELQKKPHRLIHALPRTPSAYASLPYNTPRPASLKMVGMLGIIASAVGVIMTGYLMVGVAGYVTYPGSIDSNILNSFPEDDLLMQIARAAIGVVVLLHYPLNHHPARGAFEYITNYLNLSPQEDAVMDTTPFLSHVFTVVFVGGSLAVALAVQNLGDVLHLIGGTAATFMIFLLPGLLLMNSAVTKYATEQLLAAEEAEQGEHDLTAGGLDTDTVATPLMRAAADRGMKGTGLLFFSPRRSWAIGLALVLLSVAVLVITIVTVIIQ